MTGKILIAPEYEAIEGPLIFLAGPIQGAYRWQDDAIRIISQSAPELNIASPRRSSERSHDGNFSTEMYAEQVDWETCHLRRAGKDGVILFWLAKESEHLCDRAYAQTTRFELAEWKMRHERDGANLVIGIESGFTGAKYIKRRFSQDCPEVSICSTLEATCEEAVRYVMKSPIEEHSGMGDVGKYTSTKEYFKRRGFPAPEFNSRFKRKKYYK
ncbi:MAG: nucleoside 2-deoxyribosyltransferase domain-containing protein [Nanoarchaeota archaeon]